ncbi:MAG: hypothetical protein RMN25_10480 [Anaerolineae bacterium]|nr:hypothetical protein [Thermoflexales bacterium]MDW8408192.1 hypothetical protein [Anaerolineae bacterium]
MSKKDALTLLQIVFVAPWAIAFFVVTLTVLLIVAWGYEAWTWVSKRLARRS